MTLEEVVCQIDGALRTETDGNIVKVLLFDNKGDVARVFSGDVPNVSAMATGGSLVKARQNLVNLLRGKVLLYDWSGMWQESTSKLCIPLTLTV